MELIRQDDKKKLLLWVICNVLSIFFFFFLEKQTHTQGRGKEVLTEMHTTFEFN